MAEVNKSKDTIFGSFLPNLAISDASHDFNDSRAGGALFNSIWNYYKDVGIPHKGVLNDRILSEYESLDKLIPFLKGGKTHAEEFIDRFLKDGSQENVTIISGEADYTIKSVKTSSKEKGAKEHNWLISSEYLYDWLNAHKQSAIAFLIDTSKGKFYDLLTKDKINTEGTPQKIAYLINNREGINDGAGKMSISEDASSVVSIKEINDNDTSHILYPIMDMTRIDQLTYRELFCSKYGITLSNIDRTHGKEAITLGIIDKGAYKPITILKGDKEDNHPNTVPTLANKIRNLVTNIIKGNLDSKIIFQKYLQQKRSGDWLQVLSCLDTIRYPIPQDTRIIFVTIDILALVYALTVGVDVLFTYVPKGSEDRWSIFFHKNINSPAKTEEEIIREEVALYPKYDDYKACKDTYIAQHGGVTTKLKGDITKLINTFSSQPDKKKRFKGDDIELKVKQLLERYTDLAILRSLAPIIEDKSEEQIFNTGVSIDIIKPLKGIYLNNYSVIRKAVETRITKASAMGSRVQAITMYINSILAKPSASSKDTKAQKQRKELIDNLSIFGSLFRTDNSGKNAIGIFSFIKMHLTIDECEELINTLLNLRSGIPDKAKLDKYDLFIKLSATLVNRPKIDVISDKDIPSSELVATIECIYPVTTITIDKATTDILNAGGEVKGEIDLDSTELDELGETAAPAVGETAAPAVGETAAYIVDEAKLTEEYNSISISDFHPAALLLGLRAQAAYTISEELTGGFRDRKNHTIREHNPVTTFYFLLREISYRLKYDDDDNYELIQLSKFIYEIIELNSDYASFEYYILEELPKVYTSMRHLMYDLKKGYYGFTGHISVSYPHTPPLELIKIGTEELSSEEIIKKNLETMDKIIILMKSQEKISYTPGKFIMKTGIPLHSDFNTRRKRFKANTATAVRGGKKRKDSPRRKTLRKTRRHR